MPLFVVVSTRDRPGEAIRNSIIAYGVPGNVMVSPEMCIRSLSNTSARIPGRSKLRFSRTSSVSASRKSPLEEPPPATAISGGQSGFGRSRHLPGAEDYAERSRTCDRISLQARIRYICGRYGYRCSFPCGLLRTRARVRWERSRWPA